MRLRLPTEMIAEIDKAAKTERVSRSEKIRALIEKGLTVGVLLFVFTSVGLSQGASPWFNCLHAEVKKLAIENRQESAEVLVTGAYGLCHLEESEYELDLDRKNVPYAERKRQIQDARKLWREGLITEVFRARRATR